MHSCGHLGGTAAPSEVHRTSHASIIPQALGGSPSAQPWAVCSAPASPRAGLLAGRGGGENTADRHRPGESRAHHVAEEPFRQREGALTLGVEMVLRVSEGEPGPGGWELGEVAASAGRVGFG